MAAASHPISILVPARAMNHYVPGLLHNLLGQMRGDDELLFLFDGTPVKESLRQMLARHSLVRWFETPEPIGVSAARNRLAREARHELLRFQDADDFLAPYALAAARHMADSDSRWKVLVGKQFLYCDHCFQKVVEVPPVPYSQLLMRVNPILCTMSFFRRADLLDLGGFDERIEFQEDWDLWLRYLRRHGEQAFRTVPNVFGIYNIFSREREAKQRQKEIDGMPVREYFFRKSGFPVPPPGPKEY